MIIDDLNVSEEWKIKILTSFKNYGMFGGITIKIIKVVDKTVFCEIYQHRILTKVLSDRQLSKRLKGVFRGSGLKTKQIIT